MSGLLTSAQLTDITVTVASSLDQSLPLSRNTALGTSNDGYGHNTPTYTSQGNIACTVAKPTASVLQSYASIIGSQRALTLRAMSSTDIRQTDHITYDGLTWEIQAKMNANSYSVVVQYLMTVVV